MKAGRFIILSSVLISTLVIITSLCGILIPGFYFKETTNWQLQSQGQDYVDFLLVVPCLLFTGIITSMKNKWMIFPWAGILLYLIYSFTIYCFDIHFNQLFVVYCLTLGLSFYSFIYFLILQWNKPVPQIPHWLSKIIAIYFLVISVGFYLAWLAEVLPSIIEKDIPETVLKAGLPTNPVQVIDLAVFLPAVFITGLLLLKKNRVGNLMAPVILVFFILMNITIAVLTIMEGDQKSLLLAVGMLAAALFSAVLLILFFKQPGQNLFMYGDKKIHAATC